MQKKFQFRGPTKREVQVSGEPLMRYCRGRGQLRPETPLQLLADIGNGHSGHDNELTAQHLSRLVVVGKLAHDAAILAVLIPAEPAIGDRFRANVLKTPQDGVFLRDLEFLPENCNFYQTLIRADGIGHGFLSGSREATFSPSRRPTRLRWTSG